MMEGLRVYIAGPMESAGGNWNFPLFDFVAERLRALGCEVFNPAEHIRTTYGSLEKVKAADKATGKLMRSESLRDEMIWIYDNAELVFLLQGWERSPGATAERAIAMSIGVKVYEADTIIPGQDFQVITLEVDIDVRS